MALAFWINVRGVRGRDAHGKGWVCSGGRDFYTLPNVISRSEKEREWGLDPSLKPKTMDAKICGHTSCFDRFFGWFYFS